MNLVFSFKIKAAGLFVKLISTIYSCSIYNPRLFWERGSQRRWGSTLIKNVFCFETIKCLLLWLTTSSGTDPQGLVRTMRTVPHSQSASEYRPKAGNTHLTGIFELCPSTFQLTFQSLTTTMIVVCKNSKKIYSLFKIFKCCFCHSNRSIFYLYTGRIL